MKRKSAAKPLKNGLHKQVLAGGTLAAAGKLARTKAFK